MFSERLITITLPLNDVNVILAGLLELPAKMSLEVIGRVKQQGDAQMQEHLSDTSEKAAAVEVAVGRPVQIGPYGTDDH